jgi:glutamate--cysteine ligase
MQQINERLALLDQLDSRIDLSSRIGLEKESLRTTFDGNLAQTPHPEAWGASLTHPYITTDYSESLAEFITPPLTKIPDALEHLTATHTYAHQHIPQEMLWAGSMPCRLPTPDQIPIATYGTSNLGKMKQLYRIGLGHRYGRTMQVIAGVHFNWSMPDTFWQHYQDRLKRAGTLNTLRDAHYMGLVRNILRNGWLISYLFGASPAVGASFITSHPTKLQPWDIYTYYQPEATSLRMGDIGYQNSQETRLKLTVNYNNVLSYAKSLLQAIQTPAKPWQKLGVKIGQNYHQLNANILQLESEYYDIVRPKQILHGLESSAIALANRGINHIELRPLDININEPLGINQQQLYFIDAFMLTYLLADSPPITLTEQQDSQQNLLTVAHQGRTENLQLRRAGCAMTQHAWGIEILKTMKPVCTWLDQQHQTQQYSIAWQAQHDKIQEPGLTPSAQIIQAMHTDQIGYYTLAKHYSKKHHQYFRQRTLTPEQQQQFQKMYTDSQQHLAKIEANIGTDFDTFLADYFSSVTQAAKQLGD